jgi:hypothetical protein
MPRRVCKQEKHPEAGLSALILLLMGVILTLPAVHPEIKVKAVQNVNAKLATSNKRLNINRIEYLVMAMDIV